jgi:tetratricopeptide (TPR) repeat protein
MGYAYRQVGDYDNAEKAFQKYIQLIPNDPNPYDSYGELLLKMGRFDDSIVQYRRALAIDPHFLASHMGISADLMYSGKTAEAAAEIKHIAEKARNEAEQRNGMFAMTSLAVYSGKMDEALASLDKQYALGEKSGDTLGMVGDLQARATVLTEMGKAAEAQAALDKALKLAESSTLPDAIKTNIALFHHSGSARAALARKDVNAAKGGGRRVLEDRALFRQQLSGQAGARAGRHDRASGKELGHGHLGTGAGRASRTRTTTTACAWRIKGREMRPAPRSIAASRRISIRCPS